MVFTFTNRDLICGVHALRTRDLFTGNKKSISLLDAARTLEVCRATAQAVMQHFQQAGYLESVPDDPDCDEWEGPRWQWVKGTKGKLLIPRYPPLLSVEEARTAIGHFHDAVCDANNDSEFHDLMIEELVLFGESIFCSDSPNAGPVSRLDAAIRIGTLSDDHKSKSAALAKMPQLFDRLLEKQTHLCLFRIGARRELIAV